MTKLLRREDWYEVRKESAQDLCNLCENEQILLGESKNWTWVAALAPYWKYHTMLVPKRHITEISELSTDELHELCVLEKKIVAIYKATNNKDDAGDKLENVLIFWRHRNELYNKVSNLVNLDHLHVHFTYDREHFLDPISNSDASDWATTDFEGMLNT